MIHIFLGSNRDWLSGFSVCKIWSSLGTHCTRSARNFYFSTYTSILAAFYCFHRVNHHLWFISYISYMMFLISILCFHHSRITMPPRRSVVNHGVSPRAPYSSLWAWRNHYRSSYPSDDRPIAVKTIMKTLGISPHTEWSMERNLLTYELYV